MRYRGQSNLKSAGMFELRELAKQYVKDLEKLPSYEAYLDDRIRKTFASNPFANYVKFAVDVTNCPLSVLLKLWPKYEAAGLKFTLTEYPTLRVDIDMGKFDRLYHEELKQEVNPQERAIKV